MMSIGSLVALDVVLIILAMLVPIILLYIATRLK